MRKAGSKTHPGLALRAVRSEQGLSLRALADRTGLSFSTLSKLENGKMSMSYDKLVTLTQGLGVDIGMLFNSSSSPAEQPAVLGRRSVSRAGEGLDPESDKYTHHYLASDLLEKRMTPIIIDVNARTIEDLGGLIRHSGEEFLYILSGEMELHSDLYAPLTLKQGDSVYFDSGMAHGYARTGELPCRVLSICSGTGLRRVAEFAKDGATDGPL